MIIKLGERLKALRKNKEMTQDELAEYLGVSYQAVSRWERGEGYPDITTLPLIADFFNTTIDDLIGVNQEKTRQKIKEYLARAAVYYNKKDFTNCIIVLREALSEFPNSDEIIFALAKSLPYKQTVDSDEIISLCNRVLSYSLNDNLRAKTADLLASHYLFNIKDLDKAKEIADKIPSFDYGRTFIPAYCIRDDNEKQAAFQQMIMDYTFVVSGAIRCCIGYSNDLTTEMKIDLYQRLNKIYEILFDGEYDYNILFVDNLELAELHMKLGELEAAMDALLRCKENAKKWDEIKKLPHMETYKTLLLNRIPIHVKAIDAFEKGETRDFSFCAIFLSELDRLSDVFAPLHDNDMYKKLVMELKTDY